MTRIEKLQFCIETCIDLIGEPYLYLFKLSNEELDEVVDFFDDLWWK